MQFFALIVSLLAPKALPCDSYNNHNSMKGRNSMTLNESKRHDINSKESSPAFRISSFVANTWMAAWRRFSSNDPFTYENGLPVVESQEDLDSLEAALLRLFPTSPISNHMCHDAPTQLVHVKQGELWDCGIACVQMVMMWIRTDGCCESRETMLQVIGTESIWSIDLIYLLATIIQKDEAAFMLCSNTFGVDQRHRALGYYQRAFHQDEVRVNQRFQEAARSGWPVLCLKYLSLAQVVRLISREDCIAIVLLDNSILRKRVGSTYAGHYVILCGISFQPEHLARVDGTMSKYCMVIKNPAISEETSYICPSGFEEAWRATGTDEDILFVTKR